MNGMNTPCRNCTHPCTDGGRYCHLRFIDGDDLTGDVGTWNESNSQSTQIHRGERGIFVDNAKEYLRKLHAYNGGDA